MAVIPPLQGLSVTISVDNTSAKEYRDKDGVDYEITDGCFSTIRYVESRPGSAFSIDIEVSKDFTTSTRLPVTSHVHIDGIINHSQTFFREDTEKGFTAVVSSSTHQTGEARPFVFTSAGIGKSKTTTIMQ
jgi:hypothetical protein